MSYRYSCSKEKRTSSHVVFMCFRRFRQRLYQAGYNNGRTRLTIEVRLVHAVINVKIKIIRNMSNYKTNVKISRKTAL